MSTWAIIVAAGDGTRLAAGIPKALVPLAGRPLISYSFDAIERCSQISGCVVACGQSWIDEADKMVKQRFDSNGRVTVGGSSRQESVRKALDRVPARTAIVVVHDAARPLAEPELFTRAVFGLERGAGAVCAIPLSDTVKRANGDAIVETVDRSKLWRAQTPQAFRIEVLLQAHADASRAGFVGTDDSALLERMGATVVVVPGDERNIKVTTPADLVLAEAMLESK
ncbi:MAG: 2-C-methyl-D-erythritol 4-phosphate cytidylyltransferase [Actinomycetota bacterium]